MAAAVTLPRESFEDRREQRILLHGVSWKDYLIMRDVLDGPSPRMTYVDGALELMSPSSHHELWKTNIARLLELYAYTKGIDLRGYGSTTFKRAFKARAAEPDECYLVGTALVHYPQIVLEVVYSAPLLDKRQVYAAMGIEELWIFEDGAFTLYRLDPSTEAYVVCERSALLPGLDFAKVAGYATREDSLAALREFALEITDPGSA